MEQALAVFRKDVRRHWPQLAGLLGLTALMGLADARTSSASALADVIEILWAACWMYLAASVIQQERLPGDRQYWLTRPYDWRGLLAAKALFLLAFTALPLIAVKAVVLSANGISPLRHAPAILASSLFFAGALGLIAAALAAVTDSLTHFLWGFLALAAVASAAIGFGVGNGGDWGALAWIRSAAVGLVIVAAGLPVLLLQYRGRRTVLSRCVLCAGALVAAAAPFGSSWHGAWALQRRLDPPPERLALRLSFDAAPRPRMTYADAPYFPGPQHEGLYLPVRLSGIPAGGAVLSQRIAVAVEGGGRQWSTGWTSIGGLAGADPLTDVRLIQNDGAAWAYVDVGREFYRAVKDAPARVRISMALTLLSGSQNTAIRAPGRTMQLPLEGICDAERVSMISTRVRAIRGSRGNLGVACAWPRPGPERAYVRAGSPGSAEFSRSLLAAGSSGPISLDQSAWRRGFALLSIRAAGIQFSVETWRAAALIERSLDVSAVRLRDYLAPRATDTQ